MKLCNDMNFEKATWQIATNRNHVFFAYSKSVDNEWGGLDRKGCAFIGTPTMEVPFSNSKIISLVISRLYPHYIYPKYIYIYSYLVYPRVNVHRDVENSWFPWKKYLHTGVVSTCFCMFTLRHQWNFRNTPDSQWMLAVAQVIGFINPFRGSSLS